MAIEKVFVVGAGLMGGGISQVTAMAGYPVVMRDIDEVALEKSMESIRWSLEKFAGKGKISSDEAEKALENITPTTELSDAADVDLVIEAVFEDLDIKRKVFAELDGVTKPTCILATNTSAISITKIAAATERPERVLGMHFFSPVPMMKLCEVIRGHNTSDETLNTAFEFVKSIGKEPVVVKRDIAGFVANRVGLAMTAVAVYLVESGVATPSDVDKAMRLGFGHAMGPCETADLTGIDVLTHALKAIYDETKDERYWPPELLQKMLAAGRLGRKTKKGFYDYSSGKQQDYWGD
ncbi:MAG: 3-hydroxyacyl-CoA dehydrogenase family protein [Actinomycetota bacterium]|nr:3-hydroxyacyl-CoA dehydrogenase family protein [Actinomycetota bacterium]